MDYRKMGVFSPSVNMDSASMIQCLQALLFDYPAIKFNSVTIDKKYNGFKIFFTETGESLVLEKNLLSSEQQPVWIYPLTTYLIILDVDHRKTPLFERELREAITKKLGRVIEVTKTDNSRYSKNWRIEIDIPEFRDLEVFKNCDFAEIALRIRNEDVSLKFWCRQCQKYGHFQHQCDRRPKMKAEENSKSANQVGENSSAQAGPSTDRNSERTPQKASGVSLEATEKYAEEIGREEVISKHLQDNYDENKRKHVNNSLPVDPVIKQEVQEFPENIYTKNDQTPDDNEYSTPENNKSRDSYSDDDDIKIIEQSDKSSVLKSPSNASNSSATAGVRHYEEDSRSSPEMKNSNYSFFSHSATAGPSQESSTTAFKTQRGAEVTTALSERLQDCINQVCDEFKILDRKKLDAFLIHVKKKSNPIRVALNYTSNTKGLKEQLQGILHMYYNTPQTGTKEDIQFIKWLNGLVERYDGAIPKKRKRSGKTDDEPSAKR